MDNQNQKTELVNIMRTMDECLDEIKLALDKLQFEQVLRLISVLTEAFIAVNQFVDSDFEAELKTMKDKIEKDRILVNEALEEVISIYDSHDMELRLNSFDSLKNSLLLWTGNLFDCLQLHQ